MVRNPSWHQYRATKTGLNDSSNGTTVKWGQQCRLLTVPTTLRRATKLKRSLNSTQQTRLQRISSPRQLQLLWSLLCLRATKQTSTWFMALRKCFWTMVYKGQLKTRARAARHTQQSLMWSKRKSTVTILVIITVDSSRCSTLAAPWYHSWVNRAQLMSPGGVEVVLKA